MNNKQISISINNDLDIISARQLAREIARTLNFSSSEIAGIATAISELARNIVSYATNGDVEIKIIEERTKKGIMIIASDSGPGIVNIDLAMRDGFSTSNSLGLGLPGVKRLMDTFEITTAVGKGTKIITKKWVA